MRRARCPAVDCIKLRATTPAVGGLPLLAACCVLLAGCYGAAREVTDGELDTAALAAFESWELRGRVALNSRGRGLQANVTVAPGRSRRAQLELSGPWGVGAERVRIDGEEVSLLTDNGWMPLCAPGVAENELDLLCSGAPAHSLRYWLRGLPDPAAQFLESNPGQGAAREFQQAGWLIAVTGITESGNLIVPRRLHISGPDATMKVAITDWHLPPPR